jgi:predicted nucleic acid-binding Zn finger protein
MKLGTNDIGSVYLGTNAVQKVYLGTNEVWSAVDPDATAFFARVTAAGGSLSTTEQDAILTLVADLKADGIWTKMKAIYPMVGASAAACAQNLKSSTFTGTFTATGWTFASTGVTPNGSSAYMDSGLIPSVDISSVNSTHIAAYSRTNSFSGAIMGCFNTGAANGLYTNPKFGGGTQESRNNSGAGGNATSTDSRGFWVNNRISSSQYKIFRNLTTNQTSNTNVSGLCTISAYIGSLNRQGLTVESQNREIAFASIGDGFTDLEQIDYYNAVQAFQTTLSRQV